MTCVVHHGPPGSYKTFALVQRVIIPALIEGRVVVTNIRGIDLDSISKSYNLDISDNSRIVYVEPDIAGYNHIARFFQWVPAGALIVMDEGQRVYPTREKTFRHLDISPDLPLTDLDGNPLFDNDGEPLYRPYNLENAFDQHRHYNWDIYISTTSISKINTEIRKIVEWAYRHRNNSGLLPWYKNTWSEFRHDAEQSGKSISHYSGAPKKYKADKRVFSCYKSTATGKAKESSENISIFKDPKLRSVAFIGLVAIGTFFYFGYKKFQEVQHNLHPHHEKASSLGSIVSPVHAKEAVGHDALRSGVRGSDAVAKRGLVFTHLVSGPYSGSRIFYTGSINATLLFEIKTSSHPVEFLPVSQKALHVLGLRVVGVYSSFIRIKDINTGDFVIATEKPSDARPYVAPERSRNVVSSGSGSGFAPDPDFRKHAINNNKVL